MCGICGAVSVDRARAIDPALIRGMLDRLSHRGPDGEGTAVGGGAVLGHRRLAIIDLSPAAAQPIPSEDESIFAAVNGEIYNHRELRARLEQKGHRFRSRSDCEVVVHLYEEEGPGLVHSLEGMFAFALWDARSDTLLLARDRLGEKPLYYHESGERIVFASEMGALLADREIDREPDDLAIHHYLSFKFVPAPATGLRAVRKLPAGHIMTWRRGRASIDRYWTPPRRGAALSVSPAARDAGARGQEVSSNQGASAMDLSAAGTSERGRLIRAAIAEAVAGRLESDVPLGVLLSGGLDSAIVAYEASRHLGGSLRTFTVAFEEADYDESEAARSVARAIGSRHVEVRARSDIAAELPAILSRYGEPFGDSSAAAVYFLAREVRQHVTVALGGDGGDELFGGYDRYRALRLLSRLGASGAARMVPVAGRLARLLPLVRGRKNTLGRLDRFVRGVGGSPHEANCAWLACFNDAEKQDLYHPDFRRRTAGVDSMDLMRRLYVEDGDVLQGAGDGDVLDDAAHADLSLLLPDDLLFKVDIASMSFGLEIRSPFLASALVAAAAALPSTDKIGRGVGKKILREAYAGALPAPTLAVRKAGFGLPVDRWLRGPLRAMVHDLLLDGRFVSRGYFDGAAVEALLKEHEAGRANHDDRIWALLCLEIWFRGLREEGA